MTHRLIAKMYLWRRYEARCGRAPSPCRGCRPLTWRRRIRRHGRSPCPGRKQQEIPGKMFLLPKASDASERCYTETCSGRCFDIQRRRCRRCWNPSHCPTTRYSDELKHPEDVAVHVNCMVNHGEETLDEINLNEVTFLDANDWRSYDFLDA